MKTDFQTKGYEDLELSTQVIIKEAIFRGIEVEVLDRKENFIRLTKEQKVEYIRQATETSVDSYVTALLMGNKGVTKKVLSEAGIRVPKGKVYDSRKKAFHDYPLISKKQVVKPKTTNYGIGISIVEANDKAMFSDALTEAFKHDSSVIVEEFLKGKEYRFLVIGDQVAAVLHRVPANVTGNGTQSIKELVEIKNKDTRRGKGYITPLEKIELGNVELEVLQSRGFDEDSVPEKGKVVFLRKNSNISTGGDSIDFTDEVHEAYKKIAVQAAKIAGAKICGVDMLIQDVRECPAENNYGIIELNFNPVLYFHDFPFEGENREVEKYVLDLLEF